jgi:uncharacterized protein GlcG (DUF336 family)
LSNASRISLPRLQGIYAPLAGSLPIKVGDVIGAVGVSGSPGKDDECAQAGIYKVADQLK